MGGWSCKVPFQRGEEGGGKVKTLKVNCGLGLDSWEGRQGWQRQESKPASSHRSVRGGCLGPWKRFLTSMLVQRERACDE